MLGSGGLLALAMSLAFASASHIILDDGFALLTAIEQNDATTFTG